MRNANLLSIFILNSFAELTVAEGSNPPLAHLFIRSKYSLVPWNGKKLKESKKQALWFWLDGLYPSLRYGALSGLFGTVIILLVRWAIPIAEVWRPFRALDTHLDEEQEKD